MPALAVTTCVRTVRSTCWVAGRFSTFAVLLGGPFGVVPELRDVPFTIGGGAFLHRASATGESIAYPFDDRPLDGGYTSNWVEFGDVEVCPKDHEMDALSPARTAD
jgi:hypothetical protein